MTDFGLPSPARAVLSRIDRVWASTAAVLLACAIIVPAQAPEIAADAMRSLSHTGLFIIFAVGSVAYMRATGSEVLLARAFQGSQTRMIVLAAVVGGLAPFCSCEVIPFVAAMLALGAPLSAAMAFWLASPLMDPGMFFITAGALGLPFALAKTAAAVGLGLIGGFGVRMLAATPAFADPLRETAPTGGCCSSRPKLDGKPVWAFWHHPERRAMFAETARTNGLFLLKWLALAYVIEALMVRYVPAEWIAGALGGEGPGTVLLATALGAPAYVNGYAAVPLIGGLIDQGMSQGAAMAFVLAGGVSCIPAAMAVWALVKPRVFAGYIGFAMVGALVAGLAWGTVA